MSQRELKCSPGDGVRVTAETGFQHRGSPAWGLEREKGSWKRAGKAVELGFTPVESFVQDCRNQEGPSQRTCPYIWVEEAGGGESPFQGRWRLERAVAG